MLGTNPIAIAFPGTDEPSVVIDLATSAAAYGKIEIASRERRSIPAGWAIDRQGHATTNPDDMINGGALLPLGSDRARGGHKGYALAAMVDMLFGVLSGANWGPLPRPSPCAKESLRAALAKASGISFGPSSAPCRSPGSLTRTNSSGRWMTGFARVAPPSPPRARAACSSPAIRNWKQKSSAAPRAFRCHGRRRKSARDLPVYGYPARLSRAFDLERRRSGREQNVLRADDAPTVPSSPRQSAVRATASPACSLWLVSSYVTVRSRRSVWVWHLCCCSKAVRALGPSPAVCPGGFPDGGCQHPMGRRAIVVSKRGER